MNQVTQKFSSKVDFKQISVKKESGFDLASFSFIVCFALLMIDCWKEIDGAAAFFFLTGMALCVSLICWIFVALLLKLAVLLPLRVITQSDLLASLSYAAAFAILLHNFAPGFDGFVDLLLSMALAALLAFPCSLVFLIPARIIAGLLGFKRKTVEIKIEKLSPLNMRDEEAQRGRYICRIENEKGSQDHVMQLWIDWVKTGQQTSYRYEIRQAAFTGDGRPLRSCVLESGKESGSNRQEVEAAGRAAMDRLLQS